MLEDLTVGKLLAYILIPLLTPVGGLICLEFIRWTGWFTTNKTVEYIPGSPVPEWKSKRHFAVGSVIFVIGMFLTFIVLLTIADWMLFG